MIELNLCDFSNELIINQFVEIDKESFNTNECWNEFNFKKKIFLKNELSCFISENNCVQGFLIGSAYRDINQIEKIAHINRIVVAKNNQGKGFGSKLVQFFEKNALELGIDNLTLEVKNDNLLNKFYTNLGYNQLNGKEIESYLLVKQKFDKLNKFLSLEQLVYKKSKI